MKTGSHRMIPGTLAGVAALALMALLAAAGAFAQTPPREVIKLTYANFPPASTFPCVQMERWKQEVEARTGGRVEVQTFPGGTLLNPKNMYDGVESGVADIGNLAMSYQPGKFPVSEAIDLPVGFPSSRAASAALYDLIEYKYRPKEFEKVKVLTLFTCPPLNFITTKPVKSLDDLKGLELRVAATSVDLLKRLGATPVAMPQSDTPDAIQKGVVKGMVSSLEVLKDFNYAAYCPYVTRENLTVVSFAVIMNQKKWDALPEDVKRVMDDLRREQALWTGQYVDEHVEEALEWSKKERGLQIFELPQADRDKIPGLVQPIVDDYVKRATEKGLPGEQIVRDVKALRDKYAQEVK